MNSVEEYMEARGITPQDVQRTIDEWTEAAMNRCPYNDPTHFDDCLSCRPSERLANVHLDGGGFKSCYLGRIAGCAKMLYWLGKEGHTEKKGLNPDILGRYGDL